VIESFSPFFKKGGNDDDFVFQGDFLEKIGGRSRDGFCQFEVVVIFLVTKVAGSEELLQANDLCPLSGKILYSGFDLLQVFLGYCAAGHLYNPYGYFSVHGF
jgi:hypothetical protein